MPQPLANTDPLRPPTGPAQGNIAFTRPEVTAARSRWQKIQDCLDGEDAVKSRTTEYLPVPDAESGGQVTDERYKSYIMRAIFYGVTSRTLIGLVGKVFGRDSVTDLPKDIEVFLDDVDGDGVGLEQQAKKALEFSLAFGRGGLLADYPFTERATTKQELEDGEIRPIIKLYRPEQIINWRITKVKGKRKLSLVVLVETIDVEADDYATETTIVYRVLRLNKDGDYTVTVFVPDANAKNNTWTVQQEESVVLDHAGKPLRRIPFMFFGPENNDPDIDAPPLYPMAVLNLGHYRNSADYEDSCFVAGQPTPVFAGLTQDWVTDVMKGRVYLGSRAGVMLPAGGSAEMLQPNPNSMPKEAMDHKESQMVAIGAKLIEERTIRRTATEARQDEASETSILSTATKNLNAAYRVVIGWARLFTGGTEEFKFELNTDFDLSYMTPQERQQLVAEWQAEAITFGEMRNALRRSNIATEDDETAKAAMASDPPPTTVMANAELEAQTANSGNVGEAGNADT